MKKKTVSYLYLALCILFWASIPVVSKKILGELSNFQMLFYSTILSLIILSTILFVQKKSSLLKAYSRTDYLKMSALGFLGTFLYYVLLYGALSLTTASEGFILAYTWPILVLVLAFIILKEKITIKKIIAILFGFLGIIVIVTKGEIRTLDFTHAYGDMLAIMAAFTFALFSILGKKLKYDQTISAFVYFLSSLVFITITMVVFFKIPWPSMTVWPWLIYNGFFVNGITYIFWFKALENGDTHFISSMLYLTPFLSLVYIYLFLDEKILISSIMGLLIVVTGIAIQWKKSPSTKQKRRTSGGKLL
jgi:drug/metabolite transporter (DMT)-like permease